MNFSNQVKNAALDAIETAIGPSPVLRIRTGSPPASTADPRTGTVLVTITLPADFMNPAADGSKTIAGVWQDGEADAAGTAGHFEIMQGTTCHIQGTVTATGAGGHLQLQTTTILAGQPITITAFTLNA